MYALGERQIELIGDHHFIAPNATVIGTVRLHPNASIWFNSVLRGDRDWIEVGENSNVQDGSVLHADPGVPLTIGRNVTIGHMAMLHGCQIGDGTLIGIGSSILNHAVVGRNSIVGAGSLITEGKRFPDGVLILGSPAKAVRELTADEIASNSTAAQVYVENGRRFALDLHAG